MEENILSKAKQTIDEQIAKVDKILEKRASSGQHFDDFMREERARLFGMLQIYWLMGGDGYEKFKK